jgi:hypothetical protein
LGVYSPGPDLIFGIGELKTRGWNFNAGILYNIF